MQKRCGCMFSHEQDGRSFVDWIGHFGVVIGWEQFFLTTFRFELALLSTSNSEVA